MLGWIIGVLVGVILTVLLFLFFPDLFSVLARFIQDGITKFFTVLENNTKNQWW